MRPPVTIDLHSAQLDSLKGTFSGWLLHQIQSFEEKTGAASWNHWAIALGAASLLFWIRKIINGKYQVQWWALLNALTTGYGSLVCVWLNVEASEALTGKTEPLRSILCEGPLTSLHRILPAFLVGYGVVDMLEGVKHGPDFVSYTLRESSRE